MCEGCYDQYGRPTTDDLPANYVEVIELIGRIYDENSVGGSLHIVLDDWNLEDDSIRWCLENMPADEMTDDERRCGELMLAMTLRQRAAVMAAAGRFIPIAAS